MKRRLSQIDVETAAIIYSQILLVAIAAALAVAVLAVATTVVATATATASLTADDLSHLGDFVCSCLTALQNLTAEVELQASQWVVEVASNPQPSQLPSPQMLAK